MFQRAEAASRKQTEKPRSGPPNSENYKSPALLSEKEQFTNLFGTPSEGPRLATFHHFHRPSGADHAVGCVPAAHATG